ncbi:MAG: RraA family protein [Chloroflexota bacterium]|nr:RraA family protein [Chloroflexota bacterium]
MPRGDFSPELLEKLRAIDTPTISNAIETFNVRDRNEGFTGYDVRCLFPQLGTMVGYAVTAVGDNRPGDVAGRLAFFDWLRAIKDSPKPVVCVFQDVSPNPRISCCMGEVMATCAQKLGAIGLLTDGGVRDLAEVEALGFHYFAAGAVASHGNFAITRVGLPVKVSGVTIRPGDLIHADRNGALVIPDETAEELPNAVETIRQRERRVLDFTRSPDFNVEGVIEIMSH